MGGYHVWWAGDAWSGYPLSGLDRLYLFEIELSPDGKILVDTSQLYAQPAWDSPGAFLEVTT